MMLRHIIFILGLSIGAAACDRAATDDAADTQAALNEQPTAADTSGTAAAERQDPAGQAPMASADTGETAVSTRDGGLPGTASALPLAGIVALLSLGGAAVLRAWRL